MSAAAVAILDASSAFKLSFVSANLVEMTTRNSWIANMGSKKTNTTNYMHIAGWYASCTLYMMSHTNGKSYSACAGVPSSNGLIIRLSL